MKLNSKGFAISTMLYGLLIVIILIVSLLMSTISFTRKSSKEFTESIVDDLESRKFSPDNHSIFNDYKDQCLAFAISKVNATCESNCDAIIKYEIENCCLDICGSSSGNCYKVCST